MTAHRLFCTARNGGMSVGIFKKASPVGGKPRRPQRPPVPALEWAQDIAGKAPRITAVGSKRLLVENCTGVLDLSDERVRLNSRCGCICVHGQQLFLKDVRKSALIVSGEIRQVELPCEGSLLDER